jgi:hypothetical protein
MGLWASSPVNAGGGGGGSSYVIGTATGVSYSLQSVAGNGLIVISYMPTSGFFAFF